MTKNLDDNKTSQTHVHTHIVPVYMEWPLRDVWKMLKPSIYKDPDGKFQTKGFDRVPDGEPTHWDIVLVRGDKSYHRVGEEECNCDLTSGRMCPHWRQLV